MKIERHSPSSLNLFAASPSMFVLEKVLGIRQPVGSPAHRGTAVEEGLTHGLMQDGEKISTDECINAALAKYDTVSALSGDKRREEFRNTIPDMVIKALDELEPYGVPSRTQGFVEWRPDGLKYPIVGYFDYEWDYHGIIVDLKTTEKLPSQIKPEHARQVALYCSSDNTSGRVTYVTPKRSATYALENIREHRNALYQIALRVERFLALSDDPEFFKSVTVPDLSSFYWNGPARQLAYEYWGI